MNFIESLSKDLKKDQIQFLSSLTKQAEQDLYENGIDEKLEVIEYCYEKTVASAMQKVPDLQESNDFRMCVWKHL